uniref:Sodium channel and clathrin linker 1 n=1 Tax=Equus asinus TaxID=9793 RepID=A0A8C4MGI4_EQUAS
MATEIDFLRDQNQRLNEVLRRYQMENFSKYSSIQKAVFKGDGDDALENSVVDQSFLAPLITEYDKQLKELNGQLKYYQKQTGEMKLQLENVIKENERLHSELKDAVEKQLEALPFGPEMGNDLYTDEETVRNLQEQLQLANQEKSQAVELWQTVSQELDRLQKLYQEHMTEAQIHVVESQKQKDQLTNFQQLTKQLHVTNENIEMTNQHFLKTVTEQNVEMEQLRKQLRSELSRQKLHTQELLSQLEMANEKVAENEKLILEHQEKANRLQRRLSQAEQRAASASQQLSVITVQRRKAASMMNLENI